MTFLFLAVRRNAVHLIQEDLSDFKEEYLDDGDTLSS